MAQLRRLVLTSSGGMACMWLSTGVKHANPCGDDYDKLSEFPAHWVSIVRHWFDRNFPENWIRRAGPIAWPPRSTDLTPPDFYLWGRLKKSVRREGPQTDSQLQHLIERHMHAIPPEGIQRACFALTGRLQKCEEVGGDHIF